MKKIPLTETITTVCCVAILAGLGTWQLQRLEWKNDITARLNQDYANAQQTRLVSEAQLAVWDQEEEPLGYGSVEARLLRDKAILLGPKMEDGRMGYHLLVPLMMDNGRSLIVNAGWVSDLWKDDTEDRLSLLPAGPITVRGVIHKPDWSSFASSNSPANDMWFRADITEMAAAKDIASPYPFILYADAAEPEFHDVLLHEKNWVPRNKHLQYALFWYALGIVMLGVYGFYMWERRKKHQAQQEA